MKLINMTPHAITIVVGEKTLTLPSEGVIRAKATTKVIGTMEVEGLTIPVTETLFGEPEGIPELEPETRVIVSRVALASIREHRPEIVGHFVVPGELLRSETGVVIGCATLERA